MFQKEFKTKAIFLKRLNDMTIKESIYGDKIHYSVVIGPPMSGKTTICKLMNKHLNYKIIDWNDIREKVKKTMGTEEEPYDGEVPW